MDHDDAGQFENRFAALLHCAAPSDQLGRAEARQFFHSFQYVERRYSAFRDFHYLQNST
jgi:hypothetical protein